MNRREFVALGTAAAAGLLGCRPPRAGAAALREPGPEHDVRALGALGSGAGDDTPAFERAFALARADGGTVVVPAGRYPVSRTLRVPAGVTLRGEGARSVIERADGGDFVIALEGVAGAAVERLAIEGRFSHGILVEGCTGARVTGCAVRGATVRRGAFASGVYIVGSQDVTVEDCTLEGNGDAEGTNTADLQCDGQGKRSSRVRLTGNRCRSADVAVNIQCFNLSFSEITGNTTRGARRRGPQNHGYGILIYEMTTHVGSCTDNLVANNDVADADGSGIYLNRSHRTRVLDNRIARVARTQDDNTLPVGAIALNQSDWCTVARNHVTDSGRDGIVLASNRAGAGHVVVEENTIDGARGAGIHLRGLLTDVKARGNVIARANGGIGSYTGDAQEDIEVSGNTVTAGVGDRPAIALPNAARGSVVRNEVRDCDGVGIDVTLRGAGGAVERNTVACRGGAAGLRVRRTGG